MADDDDDFASMLAEFEQGQPKGKQARRPKVGDVVRGKVVSIGKDAVFVDLGGKAEGVLDREQVVDPEGALRVKIGDEVEARVADDKGGALILKIKLGARGPEARAELVQAFELSIPVEGVVTEVVKGGLAVDIAGVRAFCPASQVDVRFVEDMTPLIGRKLAFQISRYNPGPRGDLVVSRRAVLEAEREIQATELKGRLVVGSVVRGTVTSIKPYGAFVDLGGVEGMLHVSELGFSRVERVEEFLDVGQEVEVAVVKIEPAEDVRKPMRISLSLKALASDPWKEAVASLMVGQTLNGTVTKMQTFGAFVEISPGLEGLVHISELGAGRRINHPREVVKLGEAVSVTILQIDPEKRRIGLSMTAGERAEESANAEHGRAMTAAPAKLGTFGDLLAKAQDKQKKR